MSNERVAQKPAEAQVLTLADISVTWQGHQWAFDKSPRPVTIKGEDLATVLSWLFQLIPTGAFDMFDDRFSIGYHLEDLAVICNALGKVDWAEALEEPSDAFDGLQEVLKDLAARLLAKDRSGDIQKATVTIQSAAAA